MSPHYKVLKTIFSVILPQFEDLLVHDVLEGDEAVLLADDLGLEPLQRRLGLVPRHHEGLASLHQLSDVTVPGYHQGQLPNATRLNKVAGPRLRESFAVLLVKT